MLLNHLKSNKKGDQQKGEKGAKKGTDLLGKNEKRSKMNLSPLAYSLSNSVNLLKATPLRPCDSTASLNT